VASDLLGRTNRAFPHVWLSLSTPYDSWSETWPKELVEASIAANTVIDISGNPGLFGGQMRGTDACLMAKGTLDIERASDQNHACDLVQAHLIQTLSAIGRENIDFYFLRVRKPLQEFQIQGALEAMESAKQDGHIGFVGLSSEGAPLTTLGLWQFHDAFEVILTPRNHYSDESYRTLQPMAAERRVGVITSQPLNWGYGLPFVQIPDLWRLRNLTQSFYGLTLAQAAIADLAKDHPVLVGVRNLAEIQAAIEAPSRNLPNGLDAMLEPFRETFDDDEFWTGLLDSVRPELKQAAERRRADILTGSAS